MKRLYRIISIISIAAMILTMGAGLCAGDITAIHAYASESIRIGTVTGNDINVRSGPSTGDDKLGTVNEGESVTILGEESGWYKIEYDEGIGYVYSDYITVSDGDVADKSDSEDSTEAPTIIDEWADTQEETSGFVLGDELKTVGIIAGVVVLMLLIITGTVVSIRHMDDDDDFDDYDDYDDDYDDYDDDYDDYDDDYYEEPARPVRHHRSEADNYGRNSNYYDNRREVQVSSARRPAPQMQEETVRHQAANRQMQQSARRAEEAMSVRPQPTMQEVVPDPVRYMSNNPDDYRIDIDPKFFETTSLPKLDDVDAPKPVAGSNVQEKSGREAELEAAIKKMDELQKEIERIKNES